MSYMTIRQIRHQMCLNKLRELGCKVISVHGVMFHVKYSVNDFKIEYIYHLNPDNTYYLERIKPYVVSAGVMNSEEEIVNAIKIDIEQFKNASQSKNFNNFIEVNTEISKAVRAFEDLYLYYNISKEDTELIKNHIKDFMEKLTEVKNRSKRVFYEKDPQSFNDQ
ncbi:hypothetical protein [Caldisalinibacter kiritimatiensis]|uniref:Uncharacterized protein n=1 Tax=Caldisalinibacter kiritimatiensis TaxID=1304284 RepID=R1AWE3_9FIRM|nr:hypothetical protein [Caldisalinibacter kiritimatiensis]EOD00942.1 hypothetical protein L21TH_1050 [Caldisalinibacter kiritimatiensis]